MADSAEIGFAGDVVQVCISASSKLLKEARQHDAGKLIEKQLQDDVDRLRLWADGFEIKAGELDILLEKDDQMKTAVIANLGSVASLLSKDSSRTRI
ncbi:hypothetical protein L228DRAFT_102685 [Xylona heveae TC161]|uniref:Uncharacterized protein n=1 Tax=Xylona heveae (strain CBS 132557 / TC161) TaxID=1328760 RepID=A0A161TQQ6_XYLHT|nr:hypothetical protein L228DRAFT_102685 [Xylona heveae TC161]KZF24706.1 hypothetical protein L228DRAFT_102685 [Xylona heveae TC161]